MNNIDWSKSIGGVILCTFSKTMAIMPEVIPVLDSLIFSGRMEYDISNYLVDVKVHMLMPGQYPCIPNWHQDFVPREKAKGDTPGIKEFDRITGEPMFLWVSGEPETEWKNEEDIDFFTSKGYKWAQFTQNDPHRGTCSREHTWRCFIRVIPRKFAHGFQIGGAERRHTQVYLDANAFSW